jgi:parallel beta-helix repeat protein
MVNVLRKKIISFVMVILMLAGSIMINQPILVRASSVYHITNQTLFNQYHYSTFGPGDIIYFTRGVTYNGVFSPSGSGSGGSPIQVLAEGSGNAPIINGAGNVSAFYLSHQQYWEISNLKLTNGSAANLFIYESSLTTVLNHFRITNVEATGTDGSNFVNNADILLTGLFNDVIIDGCTAHDSKFNNGILVNGFGNGPNGYNAKHGNNVTIQNCTVYDTTGNGILIIGQDNCVIHNCIAHDNGSKTNNSGCTPGGIWLDNVNYGIIQNCEVYNMKSWDIDGSGFDIDMNCNNCTVQYCYAHNNQGPGLNLMDTTSNTIFRYNVLSTNAQNCLPLQGSEIFINGGSNNQIYNNFIFANPTGSGSSDFPCIYYYGTSRMSGTQICKNNIVCSMVPIMINAPDTVSRDYNCYHYVYGEANARWVRDGMYYNSFSSYQSYSGQDAHSINTDPKITKTAYVANGINSAKSAYTLNSASPALKAGCSISDNGGKDFFGNSVPPAGAVNIGAYNGAGVNESYTLGYSSSSNDRVTSSKSSSATVSSDSKTKSVSSSSKAASLITAISSGVTISSTASSTIKSSSDVTSSETSISSSEVTSKVSQSSEATNTTPNDSNVSLIIGIIAFITIIVAVVAFILIKKFKVVK